MDPALITKFLMSEGVAFLGWVIALYLMRHILTVQVEMQKTDVEVIGKLISSISSLEKWIREDRGNNE
jgi:hypothetical protein